MPIGRLVGDAQREKVVIRLPNATTGEPITAGMAVAVVEDAGSQKIFRCGASLYGLQFFGFADETVAAGELLNVITGRGSLVEPLVNGVMAGNDQLFLSSVLGFVQSTPPTRGTGVYTRPVGQAISSTEMVLLTDARFGTVG